MAGSGHSWEHRDIDGRGGMRARSGGGGRRGGDLRDDGGKRQELFSFLEGQGGQWKRGRLGRSSERDVRSNQTGSVGRLGGAFLFSWMFARLPSVAEEFRSRVRIARLYRSR